MEVKANIDFVREIVYADFHKRQLKWLEIIGIKISIGKESEKECKLRRRFQKLRLWFNIGNFIATMTLMVYCIPPYLAHYSTIIQKVSSFLYVSSTFLKILIIKLNKSQISELLNELSFQSRININNSNECRLKNELKGFLKLMKFYSIQSFLIVFLILVYTTKVLIFEGPRYEPLIFWIPIEITTKFRFISVSLHNFLSTLLCLIAKVSTDWLLYSIITNVSLKYKSFCDDIKECLNKPDISIGVIKPLFEQHNNLIKMCCRVEDIYSPILLCEIFLCSFTIGSYALNLVLTDDLVQSVLMIISFGLLSNQTIVPFYFGQRLITSSNKIFEEIYNCNWYLIRDLKVRKMILLMVMKAQRPDKLTAMKIREVSFKTFRKVHKNINVERSSKANKSIFFKN